MFRKYEYYVVTHPGDIANMVFILGAMFFIFGEVMYARGKRAGTNEK